MATTSITGLRRIAGIGFTLLFSICLCVSAAGQTPVATASFNSGLTHPTGWGGIQQTAIDNYGDWLVVDNSNGALYEFPAGGGAVITLAAVGSLNTGYGNSGNPGIAIDPGNNLYVEANYNNALVMFPWNAATKTWTGLSTMTPANPVSDICTNSGKNNLPNCWAQYSLSGTNYWGYFQPLGIAIGNNDNVIVGIQNSGNGIMSIPVTGAWTNPVANTPEVVEIISMTQKPVSVAQDPEGNIYFVENTAGLPGVYEIPAGTTGLASDCATPTTGTPTGSTCLTRVDPNLPSVVAVITDATGNLYISDSTAGVFMVPNPSGTPQTSAAVMLTPVPPQGEVAIDTARDIMYVPTSATQSNGQADVAEVQFGAAELGSSPVGKASSPAATVSFGFNSAATPASFVIEEKGAPSTDFAIAGGTCATGTAYAALTGCTETVTVTPHTVGSVSANLFMLDAGGNVLSSIVLHGTGVGSNIQATPAVESAVGGSLMTPSQIATDLAGNVYVADAGLKQVLMYAAGSGNSAKGVSIGTGLTAPTGVAVDGAGDVYIADSGNVFEVPVGPSGLNAKGQLTLVSGLGTGLNLAADGLDNLYIADPANKRVVKLSKVGASTPIFGESETFLTAGFTAPSYIAVDTGNNLYVVDGANLFELAEALGGLLGAPTTLLNDLSGATGVAVDPSGAVYVSSTGGTLRVPYVSGALAPANQTAIATSVTNPFGVAIDYMGDVYLTDGTALNIHLVEGPTATLTFPAVPPAASLDATVVNSGNAPLTVTAYTTTNPVDYTAADGTCIADSPLAAGGTCQVDITLNPGPGEQGTLTGQIGITSNAVNSPVVIDTTGAGAALAGSLTKITVASTSEVVNTPVTVTVTPSSGAGVPTGEVTVTYASFEVLNCALGKPTGCSASASGETIVPTTATSTGTLKNGTVTLNLAPLAAGSDTFTAVYGGDRTYGRSTGTITATVAKSNVISLAAPANGTPPPSSLPYILETSAAGDGGFPYDGNEGVWEYTLTLQVNTAFGQPSGTVSFMDQYIATGLSTTTTTGLACPESTPDGVSILPLSSSAQVGFETGCLPQPQQPISYFPIISKHIITPSYSGDANFNGITGASETFYSVWSPAVQICPATGSGQPTVQTCTYVSTQANPPALTVAAGQSASLNLSLFQILGYGFAGRGGRDNDYTFPVSLACDNLPPHATCSFSYPTPDANIPTAVDLPCQAGITMGEAAEGYPYCTPGSVTVTIYTNVAVGTTTTSQLSRPAPIAFAAMFGFGMIGLVFRRRIGQKGRLMLMIFLMILSGVFASSLTACSTTTLGGTASANATPPGTYPVTITGQAVGSQVVVLSGTPTTIYGSQNQVTLPFTVNVTVQ